MQAEQPSEKASRKMTAFEKVKKAIVIETQLKDFGHNKADPAGKIEFVTTAQKIHFHDQCCENAARAALLALAECELPESVIKSGCQAIDWGGELCEDADTLFRAMLHAIASQESGQ